jgi:hypothetical protein
VITLGLVGRVLSAGFVRVTSAWYVGGVTVGVALVTDRPGLPAAVSLSDGGLADEFRRALRESRRWEARQADLLAEAERRGVAHREGYASTTAADEKGLRLR